MQNLCKRNIFGFILFVLVHCPLGKGAWSDRFHIQTPRVSNSRYSSMILVKEYAIKIQPCVSVEPKWEVHPMSQRYQNCLVTTAVSNWQVVV